MQKIPLEIFVERLFNTPRYKEMLSQLDVDAQYVRIALVAYLKDQGINFVSESLIEELGEKLAKDIISGKSIITRQKKSKASTS